MCQLIQERFPKRFVRSLEGGAVDSALLLEDRSNLGETALERVYNLINDPNALDFLYIEIKVRRLSIAKESRD